MQEDPKVTNSSNEDRIRKWREMRTGQAASGVEASSPAIPTRREEELAEEAAVQAEMVQRRLPTENEIEESMTEARQKQWWAKLKLRQRATMLLGIPLIIALIYGVLLAPSGRAVEGSFVIMRAGQGQDSSRLAGIVGIGGGEGLADAYRIREYLRSREAMLIMETEYGFLSHFREGTYDPFNRPITLRTVGLDEHDFYKRKVRIGIDVREGIVRVEVEALSDADAARFADGLLKLARERTAEISDMLHKDQTISLEEDVRRAESQMREASNELAAVQRRAQEVDPQLAASTTYQLISNLQATLVNRQAQRDSIVSNGMTESPLLPRLTAEIASLNRQIQEHHARLAGGGDRTVAAAASNLGPANTKLRLSQIGLEASLRTLEQANLNNIGQRRYLVVISKPVLPYDVLPKRLAEMFGFALIVTLMAWGISRTLRATLLKGRLG